jgi:hypothetical protein
MKRKKSPYRTPYERKVAFVQYIMDTCFRWNRDSTFGRNDARQLIQMIKKWDERHP